MYRYRDTSGSTSKSLKAIKYISKVGSIKYIKGYCYKGRYNTNHIAVMVRGENGSARLNNFSWGYSGEGPRGLKKFLEELNIDQTEIDRVLNIPWNGWDKVEEYWRINV